MIGFPKAALALALLLPLAPASRAADDNSPADTPASGAAPGLADLHTLERHEAGALPLDSRLSLQLPEDTVVLTLEVGDQRFHALRQPPDRAEPIGTLLLLPDPELGPAWPRQVAALRYDLAQAGWLTLALEPPAADVSPLPARTLPVMTALGSASAAAPDTGAAPAPGSEVQSPRPFAERFRERLDLALEELRQTPAEVTLVIAFGRAAPWAADYLRRHPELKLELMLLDPLPDQQPEAPVLGDLWAELGDTRVIDLYQDPLPGYPQAHSAARIRREQATRAGLAHYTQSRIATPLDGWREQMPWLSRRVRGLIQSRILEPLEEEKKIADNRQEGAPSQSPPGIPAD